MGKNTYMHAEKALGSNHHTYYSGALFCPDTLTKQREVGNFLSDALDFAIKLLSGSPMYVLCR
jgi:hypothetical protein